MSTTRERNAKIKLFLYKLLFVKRNCSFVNRDGQKIVLDEFDLIFG